MAPTVDFSSSFHETTLFVLPSLRMHTGVVPSFASTFFMGGIVYCSRKVFNMLEILGFGNSLSVWKRSKTRKIKLYYKYLLLKTLCLSLTTIKA